MKKLVKRSIAAVLTLALCVGLLGVFGVTDAADGDIAGGTYDGVSWRITAEGELIIGNGTEQWLANKWRSNFPWQNRSGLIKSVRFDGIVHGAGYLYSMFEGCGNATTIDLNGFETSNATNMSQMFRGCSKLVTLDASGLDTSKVELMQSMFSGCSNLTELDISSFDTSKAQSNFTHFFLYNCSKLNKLKLGVKFVFGSNSFVSVPSGEEYSGKWIREDRAFGPYTPNELSAKYSGEMAGTWVWEKAVTDYTLKFDNTDADVGAMPNQEVGASEAYTLPKSTLLKYGADFDHWEDGNGNTYPDQGTIPAGRYAAGSTVTLTPVFTDRETKVIIRDGEFEITLRGGERAQLDDLPAGTLYQVYEQTPEGWVLQSSENVSGVIYPKQTSEAKFRNKYQPDTVSVQFTGAKYLDGQPAASGSFRFTLEEELEGGSAQTLESAYVQNGGFIQFQPIMFTKDDVGTHTYKIYEIDTYNTTTYAYDTHQETVTVNVALNQEGKLTATVQYDEDGIIFKNETNPGELRIQKQAYGSDVDTDEEYTIEIEFTLPNGMASTDDIYWYIEGRQ